MAGSTQATLEQLFADLFLYSDSLSASSEPTNTLVTTFINNAILYIAKQLEPQELKDSSGTAANITINTNTVSLPSTYIKIYNVFYQDSSGKWTEVMPRNFSSVVNSRTANSFFDTTKVGTPQHYVVQGDSIIFDKHFDRTATGVIKVFGLLKPTVLSTASSSTQTELDTDFDMLIMYKAAELFYLREEDLELVNQYRTLSADEEARIRQSLAERSGLGRVEMDPRFFTGGTRGIEDPNIFFSS
jgi:hypothetical protein